MWSTQEFGLWYPINPYFAPHSYTDADYVGNVDDHKSTSGGAFYLWPRLVYWFHKEQSSIALSIVEAEYVVVSSCCTHLLWMIQTFLSIQASFPQPLPIFHDNASAISISKNPFIHSKTKHIPINIHFLREKFLEQKVKLEYVPSHEQVVNLFTKLLPCDSFEYLIHKLGMILASSIY